MQAELNSMTGILDSLLNTTLATVLPGRVQRIQENPTLLWKPLTEPRVPLKVGLVYRDAHRQQPTLELLRSLLEEVTGRPGIPAQLDVLN